MQNNFILSYNFAFIIFISIILSSTECKSVYVNEDINYCSYIVKIKKIIKKNSKVTIYMYNIHKINCNTNAPNFQRLACNFQLVFKKKIG